MKFGIYIDLNTHICYTVLSNIVFYGGNYSENHNFTGKKNDE